MYQPKYPYRDGTPHILFSPEDLIARRSAARSRRRRRVLVHGFTRRLQRTYYRAADLGAAPCDGPLKRVFELDITLCLRCGGMLRVIGDVTDPRPHPQDCRPHQQPNTLSLNVSGRRATPIPHRSIRRTLKKPRQQKRLRTSGPSFPLHPLIRMAIALIGARNQTHLDPPFKPLGPRHLLTPCRCIPGNPGNATQSFL